MSDVTDELKDLAHPPAGFTGAAIEAASPILPAPPHPAISGEDSAKILEESGFATYCWDQENDFISWSANAVEIFNTPLDEIATGRSYLEMVDTGSGKTPADLVQHADVADNGSGIPFSTDYAFIPWRGAEPIWVQDTGRWYKHGRTDGGVVHGVVRRIEKATFEIDELQRLSKFDEVTGQLNRRYLMASLANAIDDMILTRKPVAFLILAIDQFHRLNDAFGFDVGDEIIGSVARRIRSHMRRPDSIGRISGNKIGIVIRDCDQAAATSAAERFIDCVRSNVIETPAGPVPATVSVGAVMLPRHADSAEKAATGALEALASVQAKKFSALDFYEPAPDEKERRQRNARIGDEIVDALNERRVHIALMPVVETENDKLAFHECLVRIVRSDGSLMAANEFVTVAERLGYIRLLDHRVLELALKALESDDSLVLSINVSPNTAADPEYLSKIASALIRRKDLAERLIIEITETVAIKSLDDATSFVTTLHELGVRIAIDDFGAGYTSFRTLQMLAIDIVKIDGGFITDLASKPADAAFVRALTELAQVLDIDVVAEGVHDQRTMDAVCDIGVRLVQGFGVGCAELRLTQDEPEEAPADVDIGERAAS